MTIFLTILFLLLDVKNVCGRAALRAGTHAEKVRVRRVGSGLGIRYPRSGDGERSRGRRPSGTCSEPGGGARPGECCEEDEAGSEDIPEESLGRGRDLVQPETGMVINAANTRNAL